MKMKLLTTLIAATTLWLPLKAEAQTTLTIPVSADAYVNKYYPTVNRGSTTFLAVDNSPMIDTLLKFNVSGIGASNVQSAKLRLFATYSSTSGGEFRKAVHNNWTELGVTYNNAPAADSTLIARVGAITAGSFVEVDVSPVVRADGTYSFRISNSVSDSTDYDYRSREAGASVQPRLILVLGSVSTPNPTATPAPSPTPIVVQPPPSTSTTSCLNQSGPLVVVSGQQTATLWKTNLAANTKVDMRTAYWKSTLNWAARIGGTGDNTCSVGGTIQGLWDPYTTSWETYHDTYAYSLHGNNMTIEDLRVDGYGDAIHVRMDAAVGNNFTLRGLHITNNHDDCVENDGMKAGRIVDSLFNGCYVFYSSRSTSGIRNDGSARIVRIENNLIRGQAFPTYYSGHVSNINDLSQYRLNGFWKIDEYDITPKLSIRNNIFVLDRDSSGWPILPDPRNVYEASGNIIVWLGSGAFPEKVPSGFTVTTDKSVWDRAVADWKARHGY
jgi:hypothetical protein